MFLIFSFPLIFSKPIPPLTAISSYSLIHFLTFLSSMSHVSLVFFPLFSSFSLSPIYHRSQYSHGPNLITTIYRKCLLSSLYTLLFKSSDSHLTFCLSQVLSPPSLSIVHLQGFLFRSAAL